jgi:DNA-binding MarR family transcriptional regulator
LSGRELASRLGVGPSAITPLVDRLVEHGLVRREEDRLDRRVTRLLVTEAGLTLLEQMIAGQRDLIADLLRHLDAEELAIVNQAFGLLSLALARSVDAPPTRVAVAASAVAGTPHAEPV